MTSEELLERAAFAGLVLGPLMMEAPDSPRCLPIIEQLAALDSLEDWPFGSEDDRALAYDLIAHGLSAECRPSLKQEYTRLFIGSSKFQAPPWGSVYLDRDSVVFGDSTVKLRRWLKANGVDVLYTEKEPPDQIGRALLLLAYLVEERPDLAPAYLDDHLLPWAPHFFELFVHDAGHPFYEGVGRLGRAMTDALAEARGTSVRPLKLFF